MGRYERDRGKRGEQELAQLLRPTFPSVRRAWEAASGLGYDLDNTGDLRFQIKRGKGYVSVNVLKTVPGPLPVLAQRVDRKPWVLALTQRTFNWLMGTAERSNPLTVQLHVKKCERRHGSMKQAEDLDDLHAILSAIVDDVSELRYIYYMTWSTFALLLEHRPNA